MWSLLELKARTPWRRPISVSPCEEPRGVTPDVVIHLGGHICIRRYIVLASHLWIQHESTSRDKEEEERLESSIKDIFRNVFRDRWSRDDMQWIMTNCSNYMIWTVRDVGHCDGIPPRVLQLAAEVASEYVVFERAFERAFERVFERAFEREAREFPSFHFFMF